MAPDLAGDGREPRPLAEGDSEAAAASQEGAIGLEPARGAARQHPVGDDDIGLGTGPNHPVPAHEMRRAGHEDSPAAAVAVEVGGAEIAAAGGDWQAVEVAIFRRGGGELGERLADIVARLWSQQRELALGSAQHQMAAVAGDEQVGRGRGQRPGGAGGDRDEAKTSPASPPQADPGDPAEPVEQPERGLVTLALGLAFEDRRAGRGRARAAFRAARPLC